MPPQRDRIEEHLKVPGRRPPARRREWVWLFAVPVPTVVAVVALFVIHDVGAAWPSATGTALTTWAITGTAIAAVLRRRDRR